MRHAVLDDGCSDTQQTKVVQSLNRTLDTPKVKEQTEPEQSQADRTSWWLVRTACWSCGTRSSFDRRFSQTPEPVGRFAKRWLCGVMICAIIGGSGFIKFLGFEVVGFEVLGFSSLECLSSLELEGL